MWTIMGSTKFSLYLSFLKTKFLFRSEYGMLLEAHASFECGILNERGITMTVEKIMVCTELR